MRPPLHLGVVAIEKGAFGLPSTMVANYISNESPRNCKSCHDGGARGVIVYMYILFKKDMINSIQEKDRQYNYNGHIDSVEGPLFWVPIVW